MTAEEKSALIVPEQRVSRRENNTVQLPAVGSELAGIMSVIAAAARDPQVDVDKMLKLYELREKELARVAEQQFIDAMAEFKANPPKIVKDKQVSFQTSKGLTEYKHATLAGVVAAVIDGLSKVGISHRWDIDQVEGNLIRVTCVLTHVGGFSTRTPLMSGRDDSGGKNSIQAVASTVTYLQRYTLLSATGLAAGEDDDGKGGDDGARITEQQEADLNALITEVGGNKAKLLKHLKLESLADMRPENYKSVCALVRELAAQKAAKEGAK